MLLLVTRRHRLFTGQISRLSAGPSICPHLPARQSSSSPLSKGPRIAVIGSGPSGLYVCARLLQRLSKCRIDVFERAQVPYGLIYYGVAPDHVDMKKSMHSFQRMFSEHAGQQLALFCNVNVNKDVTYEELCDHYDSVVLAYGASKARKLGLGNEDNIENCISGSAFVSWYNGAPEQGHWDPLLDQQNAVVIGNGNVAIDCSRILLTRPDRLASTDITEHALRSLRHSRVRRVQIVGRRGPENCSFTIKELRELLSLDDALSHCEIPKQMAEKLDISALERPRQRLLKLMMDYAGEERARKALELRESTSSGKRILQLLFHRRPESIEMDGCNKRVKAVKVRNVFSGEVESLPCGLLIYAIGFENVLLEGLPTTESGKLAMSDWCRVPNERAAVYATGWCSHAARGLIADSQQQAYSVADQIAEDWGAGRMGAEQKTKNGRGAAVSLLRRRNVSFITWEDWRYIDHCERLMGSILGKSREKITDFTSFLRIIMAERQ